MLSATNTRMKRVDDSLHHLRNQGEALPLRICSIPNFLSSFKTVNLFYAGILRMLDMGAYTRIHTVARR